MIRQRLHRRWAAIPGSLWRVAERHRPNGWAARYFDWNVERYGEYGENEPWVMRQVTRFVCWLQDWKTTWQMRP